jgi:flagellar biosynthesis chaperone FliJ
MTIIIPRETMNKLTLEDLLAEILQERENLSPEIIKKIDRFGELNIQMEKARAELDKIRNEYKSIESELLPILEELDEYSGRTLKTQKFLITIKKMGFTRTMYQYSKVLDEALKTVNEDTKKMLSNLLDTTATVQRIAASISVQKLDEGFFETLSQKVKGMINSLVKTIKLRSKNMDTLSKLAQRIVSGKED